MCFWQSNQEVSHMPVNSLRPSDTYASVNQTIIGWDNGLSPGQHQAITWTNAVILPIGALGRNFNEILMEIQIIRCVWKCHLLTLKHWEMHGCVVSTVATDALVLKHQAISIHNAD